MAGEHIEAHHEPSHSEHAPSSHHPGSTPAGGGKGGKGLWKNHKVEIIAAALGIAVTIYLYMRNKASTTASSATTPTTDTTGTTVPSGAGGGGWGGGWSGSGSTQGGVPSGSGDTGAAGAGTSTTPDTTPGLTGPGGPSVVVLTVPGATGPAGAVGPAGKTGGQTTPVSPVTSGGSNFNSLVSAANAALAQGQTTIAGVKAVQGLVNQAVAAAVTPQQVAAVQPLEARTNPIGSVNTITSQYGTAATAAVATQTLNPGAPLSPGIPISAAGQQTTPNYTNAALPPPPSAAKVVNVPVNSKPITSSAKSVSSGANANVKTSALPGATKG